MPVVITMSAISAFWASTAKAWRITRSCWAVRARKTPRSARFADPASIAKASWMRSRTSSTPIRTFGTAASVSSTPIAASARSRSRNASMLVRAGRLAEDNFIPVVDGVALPDGPVIVSLKRFLAERDHILARGGALGVRLETGESPQELQPYLGKLAVVVLHIPGFRDGRAFSAARL